MPLKHPPHVVAHEAGGVVKPAAPIHIVKHSDQ
jgi:hypothetical protein